MNDLHDSVEETLQDDRLALIYKSNETNLVAVKTPVGMTKRVNIELITQQGGTWGPISCSNSIDKIGKQCDEVKRSYCYFYKDAVKILPL